MKNEILRNRTINQFIVLVKTYKMVECRLNIVSGMYIVSKKIAFITTRRYT